MPITLRARPTCHYCGKRNGPSQNQSKFTCQYCQADNYLDEDGQITDVPSSAIAPSRQYAVPLAPSFDNVEGSIFCATCLKNQYMYNAALSEYLPDPDHPEYDTFEAAIPAFKKDLERRYPTCCSNCEPRVKAQLQQATYNARSDHVRRVLDRSRQRRNANTWGWRSLVVNAAGLGWLISLGTQLVWHALGSQAHGKALSPVAEFTQCFKRWPVPVQCPGMLERFVGPSILLGSLCIWWNPMWQHKLEGREGRLVGLDRFYKVQGVLLALRFILWTLVNDVPDLAGFRSMIHTISLVLVTMVAGWSRFSIIKTCMPRIVDWSQNPAPLLDNEQYVPPPHLQEISPPNSQQAIPVNIFDTSTPRGLQSWRPPTPPVDEDAMEWDPTPNTFSPNPKRVNYKSSEPTPFRGTLAALPRSNIYGTRNEAVIEQPKAIGLPAGMFDKSHGKGFGSKEKARPEKAGLAQPKFFPQVTNVDTGLENIFDKVFSLKEEAQVPTQNVQTLSLTTHERSSVVSSTQSIAGLEILGQRILDGVVVVGLTIFTFLFAGERLFDLTFSRFGIAQNMSNIIGTLYACEVIGQMILTQLGPATGFDVQKLIGPSVRTLVVCVSSTLQPEEQSLLLPFWSKLVTATLVLALALRVYHLCISDGQEMPALEVKTPSRIEHEIVSDLPFASQAQPAIATPKIVRRSSSDESMASTASIATTSTASGWKTPLKNHREELRDIKSNANSSSYGLGGLSLKNDHGFGTGNNVAGTRTRRTPARSAHKGW